MYLWQHKGRNLGPLQDVPPVPGPRLPHGLEPNAHHQTTHRMANRVPCDPRTRHHPEADGGIRGGPQGARPHCCLHPATHPHGRPPGYSSTHATDSCRQNGCATHVPHPQVPAACSQPTPDRPGPTPQTHVLSTVSPQPATYHPMQDYPPPARAPSAAHNTDSARTSTTGTVHTHVSMPTPQAPLPQRHHSSTGTAERRPPRAPSLYANGYHRRPSPATQTTGSA